MTCDWFQIISVELPGSEYLFSDRAWFTKTPLRNCILKSSSSHQWAEPHDDCGCSCFWLWLLGILNKAISFETAEGCQLEIHFLGLLSRPTSLLSPGGLGSSCYKFLLAISTLHLWAGFVSQVPESMGCIRSQWMFFIGYSGCTCEKAAVCWLIVFRLERFICFVSSTL